MRILIVEDEPEMAALIAARLQGAGFTVDAVTDCAGAEDAVAVAPYGLVLLDRRLPDGDGKDLLARFRRLRPGMPVILVSALDGIADKVGGLDAGADDYLTKPFIAEELMARIRTVLRRPSAAQPPILLGRLSFDPGQREAFVDGAPLVLRRRELSVLESLIRRAGRVVQRETLIEEMFGFDDDVQSNTLDSHVSRLRSRLADAGAGVVIHPVRGIGYMLARA